MDMVINMKKILLSALIIGAGWVSATSAAVNKETAYIDIAKVQKENPFPENIDVSRVQKEAQAIIAKTNVVEASELPSEIQKGKAIGKIELPPQKVPDYLDDKRLEKQRGMIDLEKIAQKYNETLLNSKNKKNSDGSTGDNDFEAGRAYLFISSSIPKETLQNLLNEAGRLNISVFLKGNIGDDPLKFMGTQKFMDTMTIKTPPQLYIHPDAFKMFKIERVPALVVAASDVKERLDEQGCADLRDFDIISGDLNLKENISQIFEKASSPDIKDIARFYMKNISAADAFQNK